MITVCVRWATIIAAQRTQTVIMECAMRHMSGCARQVPLHCNLHAADCSAVPDPAAEL